jgi:hypothetical protein
MTWRPDWSTKATAKVKGTVKGWILVIIKDFAYIEEARITTWSLASGTTDLKGVSKY